MPCCISHNMQNGCFQTYYAPCAVSGPTYSTSRGSSVSCSLEFGSLQNYAISQWFSYHKVYYKGSLRDREKETGGSRLKASALQGSAGWPNILSTGKGWRNMRNWDLYIYGEVHVESFHHRFLSDWHSKGTTLSLSRSDFSTTEKFLESLDKVLC